MKLRNIFRTVYLLGIVGFILWYVVNNIDVIQTAFVSVGIYGFTLAFALSILSYLLLAKLFVTIQMYSEKPMQKVSMGSWFCGFMYSFMGRYIPGKVAIILGRIHYFSKYGISKKSLTVSSLYENFFVIIAAGLLSIPMLPAAFAAFGDESRYLLLAGAAIAFMFFFIFSSLFERLFLLMLSLMKHPVPEKSIFLSKSESMHALLYAFLSILCVGSSFFVLLANTTDITPTFSNLILVAGAYMFSGAIGIVALFAPSGLGVREGVAVFLMNNVLELADTTDLIAVLIFIRAVMILSEILLCSVSYVLHCRAPQPA